MNKNKISKYPKLFFLAVIFLVLMNGAPAFATDPQIVKLSEKTLASLNEPKFNITTLKNGIKVYYLKDSELPVFKMMSYFETGSLYEKKDELGISSFFFLALRAGGTEKMKSKEIDDQLDFLSADISAHGGADLSTVKMSCLMKDLSTVLATYFDIMRKPAFEKDRIDIIKKNILNSITRRNEDPIAIALREFAQSLYGTESPYAWLSTPATISKIDHETLSQYYKDNIAPSRMRIAASSPLDFEEFLKILNPAVADWTTALPSPQPLAPIQKNWEKTAEFIQKDGNQSVIVLGHFGERRFNKDKFKIIVANEILGASTFGSRLGNRIRTDLGLAYSIRSDFGFETDYGPFRMVTQTKSQSTVQAVTEIQKILSEMVKNQSITEAELKLAKERIINRLIFQYDSVFNMVTMRLIYDYYGYPPDYLNFYREQIDAVTLDQVNAILSQYFFPDKLKMMIVGDKTKITDLNALEGLTERPLDNE